MKRSRGFTLIELLIVVAVIGVGVAGIAMFFGGPSQTESAPSSTPAAVSTTADPVASLQNAGFTSVMVAAEAKPSAYRETCVQTGGAAYDVSAVNAANEKVDMVVCCGGTSSPNGGCTPQVRQ